MTFREILQALASITHLSPPTVRMPYSVALCAGVLDSWVSRWLNRTPRIPLEGIKMARHKMFVNSGKAESELGYHPGPVEPALERAIRWFQENGFVGDKSNGESR